MPLTRSSCFVQSLWVNAGFVCKQCSNACMQGQPPGVDALIARTVNEMSFPCGCFYSKPVQNVTLTFCQKFYVMICLKMQHFVNTAGKDYVSEDCLESCRVFFDLNWGFLPLQLPTLPLQMDFTHMLITMKG